MDSLTLAIAIGLMVSLLFTEFFGLSTGGMIVPGYLALHLDRPLCVVATLLTAFLTFALVRALSQVAIVYGRRRIVLMILFGFAIGTVLRSVTLIAPSSIGEQHALKDCFHVVGFIIPGLIALWIDRQGWVETLAPLMTSSVLVRLVLVVLGVEVLS